MPPRRDRPVHFAIPAPNSANDSSKAMAAITTAVASGELTPTEAAELSSVVVAYVKAIETTDFFARLRHPMRRDIARRIERLEQRSGINADPPPPSVFLCFADDQAASHATSGAHEWQRRPHEQQTEFEARIVADLKAAQGTPPFIVMFVE